MEPNALAAAEILAGLDEREAARLLAIARPRQCARGECLFLLGDHADRLYVVRTGTVELTLPVSFGGAVRDIPVESTTPGHALGWSALVTPHRFTRSARAAEDVELAAFLRQDLLRLFEVEPHIGYVVMRHVAEIVGRRTLQVEALWVRELQRTVTDSLTTAGHAESPARPKS